MTKLHQATPFLHVPDFAQALHFFETVLAFSVPYRLGNYFYCERGSASFRVLEEKGRLLPAPGQPRMTAYVDVQDVDALYRELKPRLDGLPAGDVVPPRDQDWGQRELHVRMPDGHWLAFGQAIPGWRPD
jgi:catechol 2,3-dioxygenase-like lactoylglutathione lyase family enzyme